MGRASEHCVLLQLPEGCRCLSFGAEMLLGRDLRQQAATVSFVTDFYLMHDGKIVQDYDRFSAISVGVLRLVPLLRGGKGGFGSMLRALGSGIERTTNREACRDLSGRRMRDVNADKKLAEWLKNEADREREREEQRRERRERRRAEPKHNFDSHSYLTSVREQSDRAEDAVRAGLCTAAAAPSLSAESSSASAAVAAEGGSSSSTRKRPGSPIESKDKGKKKRKRGLDDFLGVDSSSSSSSEDEKDSDSSAKGANS